MKKFVKKSLALGVTVVMLLSLLTVGASAAAAESFTDIAGSPYAEAIQELAKAGIVNGVGNGKYSPNTTITRAMAVTILGRMAKVTPKDTDRFSDVVNGSWYSGYVGWAEENGIVEGVGGGRFEPQRAITGEEMALMLEHYAKMAGVDYTASNTSKAALTRGEMAGMVYSVYKPRNPSAVTVDPSVPIAVEGGQITGTLTSDSKIAMWKGIPYAAAPVGELRWRAPQPVESWTGVKECLEFGAPAMQAIPTPSAPYTAEFLISNAENMSEDCLTLNVWSPAGVTDELLPVVFYIHGGGNTEGGSNIEIYDGEKLARQGVVYVSINYRLGIFGSMAHPQLSAEDEHGVSGNQAMLDQIKALKWVHDYIAEFGGDPDNITIAGQSAGGMAVNTITSSPLAEGLFAKAVIMSGIFGGVGARTDRSLTLDSAEQAGVAYCQSVGMTLDELRALSAKELQALGGSAGGSGVIDGYSLVGSVADAIYDGDFGSDVPLMIGMVGGDTTLVGGILSLNRYRNGMTASDYESLIRRNFGEMAERALALYPATDETALDVAAQINSDKALIDGYLSYAQAKAENSRNPVYVYIDNWDYASQAAQGPFHSSDIPYWLGGVFSAEQTTWTEHDYELATIMSGYLVNFAKNGNVNGGGLPQWNAYNSENKPYVLIDDTVEGINFNKEKLSFWTDYNANPPEVEPDDQPAGANSATITWKDSMFENTGTLTINPATSEWTIIFTAPMGEYLLSGTYDKDYVLTVVEDGGLGNHLELEPIQEVAGPAIKKILHSRTISWTDMFENTGTLTIDPDTNGWELYFLTPMGDYLLSGTYDEKYNLTVIEDGGLGSHLELEPIQAAAGPAIKEILYSRTITWKDMFENTGILTIDPDTNEWELYFVTPMGDYLLSGTYDENGILTVIEDGGLGSHLELDPIQAAAGPAILEMLS